MTEIHRPGTDCQCVKQVLSRYIGLDEVDTRPKSLHKKFKTIDDVSSDWAVSNTGQSLVDNTCYQ